MKKFLFNVAIFFAIVSVVDFSFGKVFRYLQANAGGRTGSEYYVCEKATEDVIIMGSSRASHHYVSDIISENLGMSCFNAGQDGNGIILQYGRWKIISKRYVPQVIIYDITPPFDLIENDNATYIDRLKPFSNNDEVKNYLSDLFPLERIKTKSKLYCYNYKFIEMFSDSWAAFDIKNKGYSPLYGNIRQEMVDKQVNDSLSTIFFDTIKIKYLECLAKECRDYGIKLIFVVSPSYNRYPNFYEYYKPISKICNTYGAVFFSYYNSGFSNKKEFFKDSQHLNHEGAVAFTSAFCNNLGYDIKSP